MMRRLIVTIVLLTLIGSNIHAQDTVSINLNTEHATEGVSEFDRSRYIVIHDDLTGKEWDSQNMQKSFLEGYDVYYGRNNGGIVWEWNNTKEDPTKPGWPDVSYMQTRGNNSISNYASNTFAHQFENRYANMMIGGQESMFPHGQGTSLHGLVYDGFEATAEYYAQYLSKFFGTGGSTGIPLPKMLEVINEPFVKANTLGTTREQLSEYHNVVAKRVKELNPEIMVGGYTAAYPAFEASDFNHWRNNWKTFIDIAGENMDFFSFHLYDFSQNTYNKSLDQYRSGSNIEAIMDMINHYSYLRLGKTLPWSISEYGWLCKDCPGGYDQREDWYNVRSFNNMLVQLLERNNQIVNAIPFILLKANWAKPAGTEYNTYGPRLLREIGEVAGEPAHGGWIYTDLIKFYQLWANVRGKRVDTRTTDPDLMADAYVDGKKMFLILSNLEQTAKIVNLDYYTPQATGVKSLMVKHCYAVNDLAKLDTLNYYSPISSIELGKQATMILEYTFADDILVNETNSEKTYFASTYFQPIYASQNMNFIFNGVSTANQGEAVLRLGLGRDHGKSLSPTIKVNDNEINIPADWRGNDQKSRDSFFGVLEIPIPYQLLKESNTITVRFSDTGGYVSSVLLQVFNFSSPVSQPGNKNLITGFTELGADKSGDLHIYPNPVQNILHIRKLEDKSEISIFNSQGSVVIEQDSPCSNAINVGHLKSGLYILVIQTGKKITKTKFIKL